MAEYRIVQKYFVTKGANPIYLALSSDDENLLQKAESRIEELNKALNPVAVKKIKIPPKISGASMSKKIQHLVITERFFGRESFDSYKLQREFKLIFGEKIRLETVTTYLGRLANKGFLEREGDRFNRSYKLKTY